MGLSDKPGVACHFLDAAAFSAAEEKRMTLAKARGADAAWKAANKTDYGWAMLSEVVPPCAMWYAPWLFDPNDPEDKPAREAALKAIKEKTFGRGERNYYLSRFYWTDWSGKRPPICVLTPVGREWVVDAKASNGDGWQVKGDPPKLIVTPSIKVPGYHGFLGTRGAPPGVFTVGAKE